MGWLGGICGGFIEVTGVFKEVVDVDCKRFVHFV